MKKILATAALAFGLVAAGMAAPAVAAPGPKCPDLHTGLLKLPGSYTSLNLVAPSGNRITAVCVKYRGEDPQIFQFENALRATFPLGNGLKVEHYSVQYLVTSASS